MPAISCLLAIGSLSALARASAGAQAPGAAVSVDLRSLRLRARDSASRLILADVEVRKTNGDFVGKTDSSGALRIPLPGGVPFGISLRKLGFVPLSVAISGRDAGDSLVVFFVTVPPQLLEKVAIQADTTLTRYADFERRRLSGRTGIFITDSVIAHAHSMTTTDLFRRFPSLWVIDSGGVYVVASRRSQKVILPGPSRSQGDLGPCVLQIIVDDVRMQPGFELDQISLSDVHGIEVYSGPASMPPDFPSRKRDSWCGAIAIWTKIR